jgi:hypothetical protein
MPRPIKLRNPRAIVAHVEAEIKEEWSKLKGNMSWGDFFTTWYLRQKEVINAAVKIEVLERENKEKDKRIEELEALVERLQQEAEKWRLKYEAAVKGVSISSISKEAERFKLIAEKVQEGKSWKQVCIEVGIRNEAKMRELLKIAFNIYDEYGKIAETFTPRDSVPEFKAWTLLKDGKGMLDYVFVPKGQEKAFKKLKEAEQEIKEKKVTKIHDPAAEVTSTLKEWHRTYLSYLRDGKEKQAMDFLLGVQVNGLKRLLEKYGEETVKDVVYSDPRFVDVFSSLLESLLRELKKKEEEAVAE